MFSLASLTDFAKYSLQFLLTHAIALIGVAILFVFLFVGVIRALLMRKASSPASFTAPVVVEPAVAAPSAPPPPPAPPAVAS